MCSVSSEHTNRYNQRQITFTKQCSLSDLETPGNTNRDNCTDPTTDESNSDSFLLLLSFAHSLPRASHVHTNTFAGYHTATLFLLNRRSLFSDLEHKGSGQRLRKNQARPPRLLSTTKKKMHGWRNRHRWRSINFQTRLSSLRLFSKLEAVSKANGQPVLHLLQAG